MSDKEKEQPKNIALYLDIPEDRWEELGMLFFSIIEDISTPYFHDGEVIEAILEIPDLTEKERVACAYKISQHLSEISSTIEQKLSNPSDDE